jgi:serine/threonine protein kinase
MNAEALVGTVLGTCTLQQLIGQGGMGAVYLAQQSRPRRQVAVKVLLPTTPLKPHHLAAFLERFRRETDAAASLEHPNIMPVYEYGEQDGLAYLVMPYISGGTLRDVMECEGQMLLPKVVNYLEQLAAALDFAHARGVIHRDIKPANILITPEGRLLLTDFGLVKIVSEAGLAQVRLTGAGAPVGTPDYMSPEQVMGDEVDGRADLYSLGIILFQMLTATTPFQGETPMQIAAQQLHAQPPMPRRFRADLPETAQQVILRSLSKRPAARYASGLELATAFRLALNNIEARSMEPQMNVFESADLADGLDGSDLLPRRGLFDPKWQTGALLPAMNAQGGVVGDFGGRTPSGSVPAVQPGMMGAPGTPTRSTGLLSRSGLFPSIGSRGSGAMAAANVQMPGPTTPTGALSTSTGTQPVAFTKPLAHPSPFNPVFPDIYEQSEASPLRNAAPGFIPATPQDAPGVYGQSGISQLSPSLSPGLNVSTGAYAVPGYQGPSPTVKLTGPVKVVQVPVAPGQYVTGLLPVLAPTPESPRNRRVALLKKIALSVAVLLIIAGGLLSFLAVRSHLSQLRDTPPATLVSGTPNMQATDAAQATATALANIILSDPLSHNVRGLPEGVTPTRIFAFKNGAYHVKNLGKQGVAVVVPYTLPNVPMVYQLTMNEVIGDDTSPVNSFGMIFRYSQQTKGGTVVSTFYSFEVVNTTGTNEKYWFYKYDSSSANPWTSLWSQNVGPEFKEGQGASVLNTFKILMNGGNFSFVVNGKLVNSKPVVDMSYPTGIVGMLVNLDGTEVAFSNLQITALPH